MPQQKNYSKIVRVQHGGVIEVTLFKFEFEFGDLRKRDWPTTCIAFDLQDAENSLQQEIADLEDEDIDSLVSAGCVSCTKLAQVYIDKTDVVSYMPVINLTCTGARKAVAAFSVAEAIRVLNRAQSTELEFMHAEVLVNNAFVSLAVNSYANT